MHDRVLRRHHLPSCGLSLPRRGAGGRWPHHRRQRRALLPADHRPPQPAAGWILGRALEHQGRALRRRGMVARVKRLAAVDIGTNSVLLLVAERGADGKLRAVADEAEITRLGRGVDRTGLLSPEGMSATLAVLERYVRQARAAAAQDIVVTATSAARDARNGAEFLQAARTRTGVEVRVISGEEEAGLSYRAATDDFASEAGGRPLLVIDVGGGSTEFVLGKGRAVSFARSLDIGSVRLTERCIHSDPPLPVEQAAVRRA